MNYCHTVELQAQFAAGGHFAWDITIKYFYNPSYNKGILRESLMFHLILTSIEANEVFLTLFLAFDKMKQNVNCNKGPRCYSAQAGSGHLNRRTAT